MTPPIDPLSLVDEWRKRIAITNKIWNLNLENTEVLERDKTYDLKYTFQILNHIFILRVSLKKLLNWNDCEITSFHLEQPGLCFWWGNTLKQWQKELEEEKEFECLMQGLEELSALVKEQKNIIDFLRNGSYSDCLSFCNVESSLFVKHVKDYFCVEWKIVWDSPAQAFAHDIFVDFLVPGIRVKKETPQHVIKQIITHPEETEWWQKLCKLATPV